MYFFNKPKVYFLLRKILFLAYVRGSGGWHLVRKPVILVSGNLMEFSPE